MNKNLGRLLLLVFICISKLLFAEEFSSAIGLNQQTAYVKEPIILSVELNQTDPKHVLLFQFAINPSKDYRIEQIDAKHDNTPHHTRLHNLYLLSPLKSGNINISFDLVKRVTNDAKLSYFFSGDRDDFKKLETTDIDISLPPLQLKVKPLPEGVSIIGKYQLSYQIPTHKVNAYEPIPFSFTLEGDGYPPLISNVLPKQEALSVFSQKPQLSKSITKEGIHYKAVYTMALSSAKSFTLPPLTFKAFNPKSQTPYTLDIPAQDFKVLPANVNKLIDTTDIPKPLKSNEEWITGLFTYFIVFVAGFLTALSVKRTKKIAKQTNNSFKEKLDACTNAKSLLQLLMATNHRQFASNIEKLEKHLYGDGKIDLKQIKQDVWRKNNDR